MDSGEEATEMTAMTSGESGASSPDADGDAVPTTATTGITPAHHRKAWVKKLFNSRQGKCVLAVVIVSLLGLAAYVFSKIIVGSLYMHSCPLDPFIPIYLVTSACLLIAFIVIISISVSRCKRDDNDDRVSPVHLVTFVYFFIHIVLQLAGSVCIIRTRNDVADIEPPVEGEPLRVTATCNATLISFSFGVVIFELVLSCLLFIVAIVSLCEVIYFVCCRPNHTKHPTNR